MTIMDMVHSGDWDGLVLVGQQRFGVAADPDKLRSSVLEMIRRVYTNPQGGRWSQSYQEHWLRNRLQDAGAFPPGGENPGPILQCTTCTLHIGFLSILETPEELARLRHDPEQLRQDSVARSKIVRRMTTHQVTPIDRVAARVAPE